MRRRSRQSGQATVEFALIVPLVVIVLLAIVQLVVIGYTQLAVSHLSREIARELAVDPAADIGHLVNDRSFLRQDGLRIETNILSVDPQFPATVEVRVEHDIVAISGLFRRFLAGVTVSAETKMRVEQHDFP